MNVMGFETLNVGAVSEATLVGGTIDVVLSIDMSGSMRLPFKRNGQSIASARDRRKSPWSKSLIEATGDNNAEWARCRFGLVPWSTSVNVS